MDSTEWVSRAYRREHKHRWLYCVIESIVLSAAIFLVFFYFNPLREAFITMNIHPLVILVALVALRYGNYLGLVGAAIASATFMYAYYLLGRDLIVFFLEWSHYKFLLMFFLTAVLLGSAKDRSDIALGKLREELAQTKEELAGLSENEKKSHLIASELKKQIVGAEDSILSLYEVATSLDTVHSEEVYTEVMTVMARFLRAKAVSIYMVDRDQGFLRLKVHMGDSEGLKASLRIDDHAYLQSVIRELKIVKISGDSASTDPIFSAAIIKEGDVIAVINIEDADMSMVTQYTFNLFKVIVEWISKALTRALEVEGLVERDAYLPGTIIRTWDHFVARVEEEKRRYTKFGLPYGLIRIPRGDFPLEDISTMLGGLIRQVDAVGFDMSQNEVHILLPITNCAVLAKVVERLTKALHPLTLLAESCHD